MVTYTYFYSQKGTFLGSMQSNEAPAEGSLITITQEQSPGRELIQGYVTAVHWEVNISGRRVFRKVSVLLQVLSHSYGIPDKKDGSERATRHPFDQSPFEDRIFQEMFENEEKNERGY